MDRGLWPTPLLDTHTGTNDKNKICPLFIGKKNKTCPVPLRGHGPNTHHTKSR